MDTKKTFAWAWGYHYKQAVRSENSDIRRIHRISIAALEPLTVSLYGVEGAKVLFEAYLRLS